MVSVEKSKVGKQPDVAPPGLAKLGQGGENRELRRPLAVREEAGPTKERVQGSQKFSYLKSSNCGLSPGG